MRASISTLTGLCGLAGAALHKLPCYRDLVGGPSLPPRETGYTGVAGEHGWTPKPTPGPGALSEPANVLELLRARAATNTWEDESTCGWTVGQSSAPFTCDAGYTCATNNVNVVGCASGTYTPFFTVCLNMEAYNQGACSSIGAATGCCQSSGFGECGTFLWAGSPTKYMYRCFPTQTIISLQDEPQFVLDASTSTKTHTSTPTPSTDADDGDSDDSPSSNIGAIVGGVVGGLGVIALFAGIVAWLLVRRRRSSSSAAAVARNQQSYDPLPPSDSAMALAGKTYGFTTASTTYPPSSPYPLATAGGRSPAPAYDAQRPSPFLGQDLPGHHRVGMSELDGATLEAGSRGNPVEIGGGR